MSEDQRERLGQLIDSIDNLTYGLNLPPPFSMHVQQIKISLTDRVVELKELFVDMTGENTWGIEQA